MANCAESDVVRAMHAPGSDPNDPTWVCQTTAIFEASEPLHWWDVRQYVQDVTSGNHGVWHMTKLMVRSAYRKLVGLGVGYRLLVGAYNKLQKMRGGEPFPEIIGRIPEGSPTPIGSLHLKAGDWIEVKSKEEIASTITPSGFNRGMRFDVEMLKYTGQRYRVQQRVDAIIHEKTGKFNRMKTACIQLENVFCRAECTEKRLACPRASSTYWREIWLKRVDPTQGPP